MIDTIYGKQVMKMGFDTAKTSKSVTDLYYKNLEKLTPMFNNLYSVKSKFTVLVFFKVKKWSSQKNAKSKNANSKQW